MSPSPLQQRDMQCTEPTVVLIAGLYCMYTVLSLAGRGSGVFFTPWLVARSPRSRPEQCGVPQWRGWYGMGHRSV